VETTYPLVRSVGILGFASRSTRMGCASRRSFPGPIFIVASENGSVEELRRKNSLLTLVKYWCTNFPTVKDDRRRHTPNWLSRSGRD
jgi:hypothetical protein